MFESQLACRVVLAMFVSHRLKVTDKGFGDVPKRGPLEFWIPTGDLPSGQGADLPSDPQRSSIGGTWTSSGSQLQSAQSSGAAPSAYQLPRCEAAIFVFLLLEEASASVFFPKAPPKQGAGVLPPSGVLPLSKVERAFSGQSGCGQGGSWQAALELEGSKRWRGWG